MFTKPRPTCPAFWTKRTPVKKSSSPKGGNPYARLVPLDRLPGKRRPGRLAGVVGPAFFEPLPAVELAD